MLRKNISILLIAAAVAASCTDNSGEKVDPSTTPHTADFNVNYVTAQSRSTKRGLCAKTLVPSFDIPVLSAGVGWYYNWGNTLPSDEIMQLLSTFDMQFVPMAWNNRYSADAIREYKTRRPDAQYLLAYNEPNLTDQANMTPTQAAEGWGELKALAQQTGLKLISPALNYGTLPGYNDPEKWFDEFLARPEVSLDDMYGIALHCYMPNAASMRNSLIKKFEKYGKPIFMTEFCHAGSTITNNVETQAIYMSEVLNYLEAEPLIEGYAWFMNRASGNWSAVSLLNNSTAAPELTELGKQYVNFSSFDDKRYYSIRQPIPAEHYVWNSLAESVKNDEPTMASAPHVQPSTDSTGILELCDFYTTGTWVEYNVEIPATGTYAIALRYKADRSSEFALSFDGKSLGSLVVPQSDSWRTLWVENQNLSAGRHRLRLTLSGSGSASFNWLYID